DRAAPGSVAAPADARAGRGGERPDPARLRALHARPPARGAVAPAPGWTASATREGVEDHRLTGGAPPAPPRGGAWGVGPRVGNARMNTSRESATYLYCLVQAERRPSVTGAPRGLPGTGGLRVLQAASDLWLVAADAPLAQYGGAPIERGLRDLNW